MKTLQYEKTPLVKPVRTRVTRDIEHKELSKYSSFRLVMYLFGRIDKAVWVFLVALEFAVIVWIRTGK